MRNFYANYLQNAILPPSVAELSKAIMQSLIAEIGWTKNVVIMKKCKDPVEREFCTKKQSATVGPLTS
ncbi:MAG: hypothetical protein LBB30_04490 [Candidatus Methanoplasma sp.]|jgi:hypothetical protein|nr:hypothetical protein [Candidatus Methanoplasma sp.]